MAEELTKKKRIRAGHRAAAKKTLRQVEEASAGQDVSKLTLLKMTLTEKLENLKILDNEIIDRTDDEAAIADEIKQADEYKEAMYAAMISIEKLINPVAPPTAARRMDEHIGGASGPSSRARLPKLTLRSFDGDITKWPSFWDSFESAIHGNEELSDIDKFNYLKSLLEHTAKDAISGLTITTANYQEAVEILKRRFGSKQQIISKHMDILLNLDPVVSTSVKALRHLHDHVESHVRGLKALGVNSETYGSLLLPVLLSKLPADIRLIASREISEDEWSLDALLKWNVRLWPGNVWGQVTSEPWRERLQQQ